MENQHHPQPAHQQENQGQQGNKQTNSYKELLKNLIIFVAIILLLWLVFTIVNNQSNNNTGDESLPEENADSSFLEGTQISEHGLEAACQDAKYGTANDDRSVVDISNYNFRTMPYSYDANGNRIMIAMWNGENADGESIGYQCYASGANDDEITVYYISVAGETIWGSMEILDENSYTEDGVPEYPEYHTE